MLVKWLFGALIKLNKKMHFILQLNISLNESINSPQFL